MGGFVRFIRGGLCSLYKKIRSWGVSGKLIMMEHGGGLCSLYKRGGGVGGGGGGGGGGL